jgi:hypothetical protein
MLAGSLRSVKNPVTKCPGVPPPEHALPGGTLSVHCVAEPPDVRG